MDFFSMTKTTQTYHQYKFPIQEYACTKSQQDSFSDGRVRASRKITFKMLRPVHYVAGPWLEKQAWAKEPIRT